MTDIIAIILLIVIGLIILALIITNILSVDTCPYCGSKNLVIKRVDATINFARWFTKCKDCGKEFYIQ